MPNEFVNTITPQGFRVDSPLNLADIGNIILSRMVLYLPFLLN